MVEQVLLSAFCFRRQLVVWPARKALKFNSISGRIMMATFRPAVSAQLTVPEAVIAQVIETPDAPAVCGQSGILTYRGMDQQANRLARYLRGLGVGKGISVGLCMP